MWGQKSWRQSWAEVADVSSTAKPFDHVQTSNKTDLKFFNSFKINKVMRAGANILSPITVNLKYPPGTVVDYAYNVFYQVNTAIHFFLLLI